jgi:uncharacterized membrane protein
MTDTAPEPRSGFEFNQPAIVALCYIASALTAFPMLIGLVLAYVWKGTPAGAWEESHFRFHIRSFWLGIVWALILAIPTVLTLGLAGWILYPLLALWFLIRSIMALARAQRHEPIANVETWLW